MSTFKRSNCRLRIVDIETTLVLYDMTLDVWLEYCKIQMVKDCQGSENLPKTKNELEVFIKVRLASIDMFKAELNWEKLRFEYSLPNFII